MSDGAWCHYCHRRPCVCNAGRRYWIAADCGHKTHRVMTTSDGRELCPECVSKWMNAGGPEERIGDS